MAAFTQMGVEAVVKNFGTFNKDLNAMDKQVQQTGKSTEKSAKNVNKFGKSIGSLARTLASGIGLTAVVGGLLTFGKQSFEAAAQAERLGKATDALGKRFGVTGSQIVASIQEASGFTISRLDAMQSANQAMLLGVVKSEEEFGELAEIAIVLGRAMGQDARKSVEDLTVGIGRQSRLILDNLGIIVKTEQAYKDYADSLGKTVKELTNAEKQQAFTNAALDAGRKAVAQIGDVELDTAAKTERLSAAFSDFKVSFGGLISDISAEPLTGFLRDLAEGSEAWQAVLKEQIPTILEWNEAQVKAKQEATGFIPLNSELRQQTLGLSSATTDLTAQNIELLRATEALNRIKTEALRAGEDETQQSVELNRLAIAERNSIIEKTLALQDERIAARALLDTQNDEIQVQVELSRVQFSSVDAINEQIRANESAIETEKDRTRQLEELASTQSDFFLTLRDAQQGAVQSEQEFNASIAQIREDANQKTVVDAGELATKTADIELARQNKIHEVLTGAHDRTQAANDDALAFWNAHFDSLIADTTAKADAQNQVFKQKAGEREAAAQAARQKELAAQAEHLEELKLNAALATLESAGQLAQFTGGLAVSAKEAADLIRSGVLPVSQELGLAIQQSLQGLQQQESEAAETSATNQAIIQEALTGTLEPLEAQSLLVGTQLPADSLLLQEQMLRMNEEAQLGLESTRLATETEDLALQNVALVTLPQLQTQTTTTTSQMTADITAVDPSIIMLSTLMIKFGTDTEDTAEKIAEAMGQAKENFEEAAEAIKDDLVPAINDATKAFRKMAEAAAKAASASSNAGDVAEAQTGMGFQSGTGPLGFRVPSGFENDSFPIRVSSGERVLVAPPGRSIENIVSSRVQQGNTTAFNMTVNTLAQPQSVIQQFEVMRALIG